METNITGKLLNEWNRGIADAFVKLSHITGPGKTQPLAAGKTDCNGLFSLTYTEPANQINCGANIFELQFRKDAKSSLHEVRYELTDVQLTAVFEARAQQKMWEGGEWNWYSKVIAELVPATDLEHKDTLGWLHKKTGIGTAHLETFLSARKQAPTVNIPAHYVYAFFRMGIQFTDRSELAQHSISELEAILVQSVENFIINEYAADWGAFTKIHTAIKQQHDLAKVQEVLTKPFAFETPLKDLLQAAALTATEQHTIGTYFTQKAYSTNFWQDLEKELGLSATKVQKLKESFLIHDIVLGNYALAKTLIATGSKTLAGNSSAQWIKLISAQKAFIERFPGNNSTEKRNFYLNSIFVKLEQAHPMPFFKARLAEHKTFPHQAKLVTFFSKNPTFEFGKQSIKKYISQNKLALTGIASADQTTVVHMLILSQAQHLAALPGENFKAVNILQSMKLNSLTEILDQGSAFLPAYTALGGSESGGQALMENVQAISNYMVQSHAVMHDFKELPLVLQNETTQAIVADLKHLFGSQDNCGCEHCRSIYSPAAYLADALHFLEREHLLAPTQGNRPVGKKSLYELLTNNDRRPDIKELLLNCENANTPLPYIDLVNEVLLNAIDGANEISMDTTRKADELAAYPVFTDASASDAVFTTLKNAIFPFNLPFDYHKTVAESWWKQLGTSPIEMYTTVHPNENELSLLAQKQFGLSEIEWNLIAHYDKHDANYPEIKLWGGALPKFGKGNVIDWLDKTGLTLEEFTEVVETKFIQADNAPQIYYFVEEAGGKNTKVCSLEEAEFAWYRSLPRGKAERQNITESQRERIYKFIRLWRKLDWSIEDVDALIATVFGGDISEANLTQLYPLAKLSEKWNVSSQELLPIWYKQTTEFLDERQVFYQLSDLTDYQVADITDNWKEEGLGDPFKSPLKTLEFIQKFDRFRDGGFDYFQLKYLLNKQSENIPEDLLRKIPSLKEEDAQKLTHLFIEHRQKSAHLIMEGSLEFFVTNIANLVSPRTLDESEITRLTEILEKTPDVLESLVDFKIGKILVVLMLPEAEAATAIPVLTEIVAAHQRTKTIPVFFEYNIQHIIAELEVYTKTEDDRITLRNCLLAPLDTSEDFVTAKTKQLVGVLKFPAEQTNTVNAKVMTALNDELALSQYNYILNFLELQFHLPASSLYALLLDKEDLFSAEMKGLHEKLNGLPEKERFEEIKNSLTLFYKLSALFGNLTELNNSFLPVYQLLKSDLQMTETDMVIAPKALDTIGVCSHIFKLYPQLEPQDILSALTAKDEVNPTKLKHDWNDFNRFFEWDLLSDQWEGFVLTDYLTTEKPIEGFLDLHQLVLLIKKVQLPAAVLRKEMSNGTSLQQLESALKINYTEQNWLQQAKNIYGPVREKLRDALVAHLLHTNTKGLNSEEDVYKHFLLDTQMSACMMTSRLLQAILSLQLFVQRCLMNLEPNIKTSNHDDWKQWEWMNRYRVWEANRKVFAYPENWIEPELRDDKSPFFEELESELMQNEMTSELGETALRNYLQKLEGVSNLEIMAMCRAYEDNDPSKDSYYIFGRTYGLPHQLYFRKYVLSRSWTAWEKVEVDVEGDHLVPVVQNGKLHLFWPIFREKAFKQQRTVPAINETIEEELMYWEIQMAWSVYENGKWGAKKIDKETYDESTSLLQLAETEKTYSLEERKNNFHFYFEDEYLFMRTYVRQNYSYRDSFDYGVDPNRIISPEYVVNYPPNLTPSQLKNQILLNEESFDHSQSLGLQEHQFYKIVDIRIIAHQQSPTATQVAYKIVFRIYHSEIEFLRPKFLFRDVYKLGFDGYQFKQENFEAQFRQTNSLFKKNRIFAHGGIKDIAFNGFLSVFENTLSPSVITTPLDGHHSLLTRDWDISRSFVNGDLDIPFVYQDKQNTFIFTSDGNQFLPDSLRIHLLPKNPFSQNQENEDRKWIEETIRLINASAYHFMERSIQLDQLLLPNRYVLNYPSAPYNWELFFHIPMYIAGQLSKNNRYEEARKWYHFIFNPTSNSEEITAARYWIFKPFRETYETNAAGRPLTIVEILMLLQEVDNSENTNDSITNTTLEVDRQIDDWRDNPFEPHRIARVRVGAYMKNVVMKYIDNLIAWGDELFRQDTMESISEATQIYMLAWEILGGKPEKIPSTDSKDLNYEGLQAGDGLDEFSNKLVELEEKIQVTVIHQQAAIGSYRNGMIPVNSSVGFNANEWLSVVGTKGTKKWQETEAIRLKSLYFCIPENEKLAAYWGTVSDRFFKLRNCMNIDGLVRQLPLYQPPIDPALLVRAKAMGLNLADALSDMNASLPHYRFQFMLQKAMEYTQEVKSLSSAFLGALQSKDAEEFSLLRSRHELTMLDTMRQIRRDNIRVAREAVNSMELSKQMTENRLDYYRSKEKLDTGEKEQLQQIRNGLYIQEAAFATHMLANVMFHVPEFTIGPFSSGTTKGGKHFGQAVSQIADSLNQSVSITSTLGNLAATKSSYNRRWQEWKHQEQQTKIDLKRIEKELLSAEIRLALAEKEAENHELQMEQSQEQLDYMKSKFSNAQLYNWMSTELSKLYRSSFEMAYQLSKKAEKAWQHELGMTDQFVKYGHWDSLYKGLLSGEKLMNDLRRMETAYLDKNQREHELIKHVSLAKLDPYALFVLRENGTCTFEIPEVLYDMDHPGHYFRRLKSVSISIPCVTGPYTSVNAKLTLEKSRYRKNTELPPNYLDKTNDLQHPEPDSRFVHSYHAPQSIATSSGQNDSGVFELNFRDERYLPFEGAGAISSWKLELPAEIKQFDHNSISDVILHIKYTAKDGGLVLKNAANASLKQQLATIQQSLSETGLHTALNLKQDLSTEWHLLKKNGKTRLTVSKSRLPYLAEGFEVKVEQATMLFKTTNAQTTFQIGKTESVQLVLLPELNLYKGVTTKVSLDDEFELSVDQFEELEAVVIILKYTLMKK